MPSPASSPSLFGLSYGGSYLLAAFTLSLTACLPLALLVTMAGNATGAERANALMAWLPIMGGGVAVLCAVGYYLCLPQRPAWKGRALMLMWALAALSIVGWWKL